MRPLSLFSARKPEPPGYAVHHSRPLVHGGQAMPEVPPLVAPPVDREAARRPLRPGLPPLVHVPLPPPSAYQIAVPHLPDEQAAGASALPVGGRLPLIRERPSFPVATPPPAVPIGSAPLPSPDPPQAARPASAPSSTVRLAPILRLDPLYAYLLYLALGLGTLYLGVLDLMGRYTVLWAALIALGVALTLAGGEVEPRTLSPTNLGWGFSFGLVFSLPLLVLVSGGLADLTDVLFRGAGVALLFQSLAFVGPLGETLFFRGALQEQRGFVASVLAAGFSAALFYWPAASGAPVYLVAAIIFSTVLAGIYSFVRMRYGLSAALTCQMTVNLILLFIPHLLA